MEHEILTVDDVAQLLQISRATVYRWSQANLIPHIKIGGKTIRFCRADVLDYIRSQQTA